MLKNTLTLLALLAIQIGFSQIITPEIEVTDVSPSTNIKVNGVDKLSINENDVTVSGHHYVNGDLVVEGKVWFGGGTNSSYMQHVEGAVAPGPNPSSLLSTFLLLLATFLILRSVLEVEVMILFSWNSKPLD